MRLKLKTAPATEPITLEEAKNHLRVDGGDDNTLISSLITTARELGEKETKRAFITQTWEMFLDSAPHIVEIPKPPLQSITTIKVLNDAGDSSTIDSGDYLVDVSTGLPGRVRPNIGLAWPSHRGFISFIVEFLAGYGDDAADVPAALRQGILQLTGHLYENRGSIANLPQWQQMEGNIPKDIKAIFFAYKILSF